MWCRHVMPSLVLIMFTVPNKVVAHLCLSPGVRHPSNT